MASGPLDPASTPTRVDPVREIRFAVVMYGGVSLAVYINGVAQELFHMVRATAPADPAAPGSTALVPDDKLTGSEAAYRDVARILTRRLIDVEPYDRTPPLAVRFVVDILSGSSAGGINAVFLGKALANDQPLAPLEALWVDEGDIAKLLNDKGSRGDRVPLPVQSPPRSLLNSRRMYWELLQALDMMDGKEPAAVSPYVRELDVWITTTDLRGLVLPIRLANTVAYERRYRNVFHFRHDPGDAVRPARTDFEPDNDPILAFAARCTSAFPFAFEPMRLVDVDDLLDRYERRPGARRWDRSDSPRWEAYYGDYVPGPGEPALRNPFPVRSMADGGALDNKPFSWATDTLLTRRADVTVDRKLIYVEPDPGQPELERESGDQLDAIQNIQLQGMTLPRAETIRDDIQRVVDRNRTIERIARILRSVDADVAPRAEPEPGDWGTLGLAALVRERGSAYSGYHKLKVATVTDDLADLVSSVAGFRLESDEPTAVRYLVRSWRDGAFAYDPGPDDTVESFNAFLVRYDLRHRLRRLAFLQRKADDLFELDPQATQVLASREDAADRVLELMADAGRRRAFRDELLSIKGGINAIQGGLLALDEAMRRRGDLSPVWPAVRDTGISSSLLRTLLAQPTDLDRRAFAARVVGENREAFEALASATAKAFAEGAEVRLPDGTTAFVEGTVEARSRLDAVLGGEGPGSGQGPGPEAAREALSLYAAWFDDYDMVAFPIAYGSDAGETDVVEIFRVSPGDATNLVDERAMDKRKLAGFRYGHFGAFLDRGWRQNDIMWGRLDGAEILIKALLPEPSPERDALVDRAQLAVVQEARGPDWDLARFRAAYPIEPHLEPEPTIHAAGRAAHIVGNLMKGISQARGLLTSPVAWLARLGALIGGLVEVALPGSARHLVFKHLLSLLYAFEALLIAGGIVLGSAPVARLGWIALGITVLVRMIVLVLHDVMEGKGPWRAALRGGVVVLVLAVVALAVSGGFHIGHDVKDIWHSVKDRVSSWL
ncbi:MAG: patatin-like protein [Actinomycetota bacterium]|nr:patatin-like protein [Actinomycetota bacterium]